MARRIIRRGLGCGLLLTILVSGLWQCTREPTGSGSSAMQVSLRASGVDPESLAAAVDSVEIEVARGGVVAAADTVPVDTAGAFATTLALPAAADYEVRVYGWGAGPERLPDSADRRVIASARKPRRQPVLSNTPCWFVPLRFGRWWRPIRMHESSSRISTRS